MRVLEALVFCLLGASCNPSPDAVQQSPTAVATVPGIVPPPPRYFKLGISDSDAATNLAAVEITLQRTVCYGWCPAYTLTLRGDGHGHYAGRACVSEIGDIEFQFDPVIISELLDRFEKLDFFSMNHDDCVLVDDAPSDIVTLTVGSRTRSFNHCNAARDELSPADVLFHAALKELAAQIDKGVQAEKWLGTEEERRKQFANR